MSAETHSTCGVLRFKRITRSTLNIMTGETRTIGTEERVEPCGAPLFNSDERLIGICRSCAEGREAEGNRAATPEEVEAHEAAAAPRRLDA
ncbi:MAG: hypothetical protein AAF192_01220 [Pseudomonadota bacterium]